jgi:DNA-binding MarR family transcriptional regulator
MTPSRSPSPSGDRARATTEITRLRLAALRLARRLRQHTSHGITHSQLSALATIDRNGPLSLGELAQMENVRPPSISRIVAALEGDGYVERVVGATDKRVALVQVTPKASEELEAIRSERDAWLAERMGTLSEDDRRRIMEALPALEALLESPEPPDG